MKILEPIAALNRTSPVDCCSNGEAVSRVADHFRALKRAGRLEPAGSKQRRGAIEHYYRLSEDARG